MIAFQRVPTAPATQPPTLIVDKVLLPAIWWRDVPVVVLDPVELNELDRFVIEATAHLSPLDATTFADITGLPKFVFAALARRLAALELVTWDSEVLRLTRTSGADDDDVTRRRTTTMDFLLLPETDDLLAVDGGLGDFERAVGKHALPAPLAPEIGAMPARDLLTERIRANRIAGLPSSVVGLADDEPFGSEAVAAMASTDRTLPIPVAVSVSGSATVVWDTDRPTVMFTVNASRRRNGGGEPKTATLDLSGARGLVTAWQQLLHQARQLENRDAAVTALALGTLSPHLLQPGLQAQWTLALTAEQAKAVADQRLLTEPAGLQISDRHTHLTTAVRFVPADRGAKAWFDRDELITAMLANPHSAAATAAASPEPINRSGGAQALRRRVWELGHRWLVHALREDEDFNYV
ncbi:hypothetical protein [Amycolatopsis sp. Hca4]|uniref:hypothetical protein n=1 Tax=Amycolatopsis sp. Hca4 TaxID=2742131 RepID=UPI001591821A|nr:hypothetical protein [Amycolatopsis sp. Hca4]QKV78171.1 hypothetical protein HUT10_33620 [Amycolatopsis sp. Hca4]